MSINIGDNFSYLGKKFLDARQSFDTLEAMRLCSDVPLGFITFCKEDSKRYEYGQNGWVEYNTGIGITGEQKSQLQTAYEHSISDHVTPDEIADFATEDFVTEKIAEASINGGDGPTIDLSKYITEEELNDGLAKKIDNIEVNEVETTDKQTALDLYSNGTVLKTIYFSGGGGSVAAPPYISSTVSENNLLGLGATFEFVVDFNSSAMGRGTVKILINDIEAISTSINQGENTLSIPDTYFSKGDNRVTIYVIDRTGAMSNNLVFYVRYGSLEITQDFDAYTAYEYSSVVRYYFTPTAVDTSLELTMYMRIDGELKPGVTCYSDTRGYFTFPSNLGVGAHYCEAFVTDTAGRTSNILTFNLIILDDTSMVVASDTLDPTIEEGEQLTLDYKVYMKNNTSFITKIYIDGELVNTGTCGLSTSTYSTSNLTEGIRSIKLEVYDVTETVSDYIIWTVTVTTSTYDMLQPVNAGAMFIATSMNMTNSTENREIWVGKDQEGNIINATLNEFAFNQESGWINNELLMTGASSVDIPIAPLSNNARYGFTLDIEFASKAIGVEDALVLNLWDDEKNCGVKITTEQVIIRSAEGNEAKLYYTDDEMTSVIFVIDRNETTAKIYLNGVMCSAFHLSDYYLDGVPYLEDFTVNSEIKLGGSGHARIKNLRVYQVALTSDEILNNFMANETSKAAQKELVAFQKGDHLPTLTVYCDFSGLGKDDKKPCKIVYTSTDEEKYGKSFILNHYESKLQYQGTSSMAYPIKNYRLNLRDENGDKWYYDFPKGKPECRFTLKADFMSSGHWTNTGLTKWINDNLYNYNTKDEKSMNPKKWYDLQNGGSINDTRECIYGFPCRLILINDGNTPLNEGQNEPTPGNTKDMGIFNFNHDKDATDTMGFDTDVFPNCASYEVTANSDTSAGAFMSYSTINPSDMSELDYIKQSFELRFPDEDDVAEDWGFMGVPDEEGTGLKALIDWVDGCTDEEFVNEFEEHFNKDYTFRYFLLVITLGMVDNLGKNMMLDTWDNKIFMPRFYDCDTICSYDNSGQLKFDVDIEMAQGYWNTSSSRLWTRIRDLFHDELIVKYNNMRQNGLSYESLMQCFYDEQIAKIPQKYYNMDYDVKYAPFADSYIGMANGDVYEHVKRWLQQRLRFVDTLYDYAPSYNNDVLTIRANTTEPMTLYIETYTPVYQHLSWYNNQMDKKKIDGKIAVEFTGTAMAATDQEVLIYGGSNIKSIKGIQSMNPNRMLIGAATKLTELDASNCPLLADVNANKSNFAPHVYLNKLNISGCPLLGGNLIVSNSPLLQEIDIQDTAITGLNLPSNLRNLKVLKLPAAISNLTLNDASQLHTLEFEPGSKMETVTMTNCNALTNVVNFDLENVTNVTLNNSYSIANELYFSKTTNLSLSNMTNLERVIYTPNDEYAVFNRDYLSTKPDYKISVFNAPKCTEFIVTSPQRLSYGLDDTEIKPDTVFAANSIDISNARFTDIKLLSTTDVNRLKLPHTVTNLIIDSAYDIDTDVVTEANYDFIHDDLHEAYNTNYVNEVETSSGYAPDIIPSSSDGSLIYSINSDEDGVWNMDGMLVDNFHIFGVNNDVKKVDDILTMPDRVDGYSYTIDNLTIKNEVMRYTATTINAFPTFNSDFEYKYIIEPRDIEYLYRIIAINDIPLTEINCTNSTIQKTITSVEYLDTSNVTDMRSMFDGCSALTSLDVSGFDTTNVTDMRSMFDGCSALTSLDVSGFDTTNVTNMRSMFDGCKALTSLDVSGFDTTNVKDMSSMFEGCKALTSLDVSGFDTTDVTSMNDMFTNCNLLTSLDVSGFDTTKVTSMAFMFQNCSSLTSLDVSNFVTSNVKDMSSIFQGCNALTSLDVSNFDTTKVTNMNNMFSNCKALTSLDVSNFDTTNVTDMSYMFSKCTALMSLNVIGWPKNTYTQTAISSLPVGDDDTNEIYTNVYFSVPSGWDINNILEFLSYTTNASGIRPTFNTEFDGYSVNETDNGDGMYTVGIATNNELTNLPTSISFRNKANLLTVEKINTTNVTDMGYMFQGCKALTSLDVSNFVTTKVTNMTNMFQGCKALTSLDVSNFVTTKVTSINGMFSNCKALTSLDVSGFDTTNVTDMGYIFQGCAALTSLDVSNFDTTDVTNMVCMFQNCRTLTSLDVSNFVTTNVTNMLSMFQDCAALTSLDVSNFVTTKVTNMLNTFNGCRKLTSLDVSNFDTTNVTNMTNMFYDCLALMTLNVVGWPKNTYTQTAISSLPVGDDDTNEIYSTVSFTVPSGWSLINSASQTMTLRQTDLDNLTDEEIAALVDEGWTIG